MSKENNIDKKKGNIKPFKASEETKKQQTAKEMIAGKDFSLSNIQNISLEDLRLKLVQATEQRRYLFEVTKHRLQKIIYFLTAPKPEGVGFPIHRIEPIR